MGGPQKITIPNQPKTNLTKTKAIQTNQNQNNKNLTDKQHSYLMFFKFIPVHLSFYILLFLNRIALYMIYIISV